MSAPAPRTSPIQWAIQYLQVGGVKIPIARLELALFLPAPQPGAIHRQLDCWLDTGAPLSVVPQRLIQNVGLTWTPLGLRTAWMGQPCELGQMDVYFQPATGTALEGPFPLIAKFAQSDPPGDPVPVLIGLAFLLGLNATTVIPPPPGVGQFQYP